MRCNVRAFFQDETGEWHQPGTEANFNRGEAEGLEKRGFVKILDTTMVEQPETRVVQAQHRRQRK